jgi:hypothetical protein
LQNTSHYHRVQCSLIICLLFFTGPHISAPALFYPAIYPVLQYSALKPSKWMVTPDEFKCATPTLVCPVQVICTVCASMQLKDCCTPESSVHGAMAACQFQIYYARKPSDHRISCPHVPCELLASLIDSGA